MAKRKEFSKQQFEQLCRMFCTKQEIAAIWMCDEDTVNNWCKREYGMTFKECYNIFGKCQARASLRREQHKRVLAGSDTMLIWWGKNYLGQTDKVEDVSAPKEMKITIAKQTPSDEIRNASADDDAWDDEIDDVWDDNLEVNDEYDDWESEWTD